MAVPFRTSLTSEIELFGKLEAGQVLNWWAAFCLQAVPIEASVDGEEPQQVRFEITRLNMLTS